MSEVLQHQTAEASISFSDAASKHLLAYLEKNAPKKGVRFSVKETGCSGLSYVIDYVEEPKVGDIILPFAAGYILCIDRGSYPFLKDMQVDYVKQGLNYKFVYNNPNQTGQCGCGESFTVK